MHFEVFNNEPPKGVYYVGKLIIENDNSAEMNDFFKRYLAEEYAIEKIRLKQVEGGEYDLEIRYLIAENAWADYEKIELELDKIGRKYSKNMAIGISGGCSDGVSKDSITCKRKGHTWEGLNLSDTHELKRLIETYGPTMVMHVAKYFWPPYMDSYLYEPRAESGVHPADLFGDRENFNIIHRKAYLKDPNGNNIIIIDVKKSLELNYERNSSDPRVKMGETPKAFIPYILDLSSKEKIIRVPIENNSHEDQIRTKEYSKINIRDKRKTKVDNLLNKIDEDVRKRKGDISKEHNGG